MAPTRVGRSLSVGALVALLKQSLGRAFSTVLVSGEVVDPMLSQRGHLYFRIRDEQADLKAVMWRREVESLRSLPQAGQQVTVRGSVDLYAARGELQLVASALMQTGRGEKLLALAALKEKLGREGLFERSPRPLPRYPQRIGIITSLGSAVLHDIYQTVQRRFPCTQMILGPASVSGNLASSQIIDALGILQSGTDVIIIARGGGSFEELLPFSDEQLIRAVFHCLVPVVSAVGHGSDGTLLDLVSDYHSATPTAAAVLVTPDISDLRPELQSTKEMMKKRLSNVLRAHKRSLDQQRHRCRLQHPSLRVKIDRDRLGTVQQMLSSRKKSVLKEKRLALNSLTSQLMAVGPKAILQRGYALVTKDRRVITRCSGRTKGEELELHFADGTVTVEVL